MNITSLSKTVKLRNGVEMPIIGLGTWQSKEGNEVELAVSHALTVGYRHIDTAAIYGNEIGVGKAIKVSGIFRKELFITTKVWNSNQGFESTLRAFDQSLRKLGLDYIDLYLVHWPVKARYMETWKALEKLYKDGVVRAIGVSNFQIHHLETILSIGQTIPMVNQVEYHPLLTQKKLLEFCNQHKIQMEAWSPLMQGNLSVPIIEEISKKYNKTPAQVVLRWDLQHGVVTIPKSVKQARIEENAQIFGFELSEEDMNKLDALNRNHRFGPDPDSFTF